MGWVDSPMNSKVWPGDPTRNISMHNVNPYRHFREKFRPVLKISSDVHMFCAIYTVTLGISIKQWHAMNIEQ